MYAQCPECLTFFHLKPSHLKAAGGKVRCSRCKHVFNALETLRDQLSPEEIAAVRDRDAGRERETRPAQPAAEDAVGDLFDGLDYTENNELNLGEPETATDEEIIASEPGFEAVPGPAYFAPSRHRSRHPVLLALANVALLLLLAAQFVHAKRVELIETPRIGPWLAQTYAMVGLPVEAPRDINALQIRRTEVSTHPDHTRALRLTAVLENTGNHDQPWPELHVDLQDRWGETVGARYFVAQEYLADADAVERSLPPRRRFAVELVIADPGSEAVGFQLRPCFRNGERYICPSDTAR